MTKKERWKTIKRLYPLADSGNVKAIEQFTKIMNRSYSVTTCQEPGCGLPCKGTTCQTHRHDHVSMRKVLILAAVLLLGMTAYAGTPQSTVSLAWTPGDNPTGTQHLIFWGTSSGVYTNLATPLVIPYAQTTCTVSNLVSGTRYYFVVQETDGIDVSIYSIENSAKTKLNAPKNVSATAP